MRHLIFVAVILQLVFTVDIKGYEFGDIILFPRCKGRLTYAHFAVYVGDKAFDGKKAGDNIFERIKEGPPNCVFSQLNPDDKPRVANYLDGYKDNKGKVYQAGTVAEITTRINEMWQKCGKYVLIMNNCEHLATYVRYGVKLALQFNMSGEDMCMQDSRISTLHLLEYLRNQVNENTQCPAGASSSG